MHGETLNIFLELIFLKSSNSHSKKTP